MYRIRPALAIIDLQNGFMSPGGSFDKLGFDIAKYQVIIGVVQQLHQRAKILKIPVFFSQAIREKSGIDLLYKQHKILPEKRRERLKKVPLCIRNTWDSDIIDALKPCDDDLIVQKRRDSIFQDTEFELWLRALRVDTIIFAGIDTSICVESSLRDAFNRGLDIILVSDATASMNDDFRETTIKETRENFGLVMTSRKLFDCLKPTKNGQFILNLD
ncbi:MAG: cysteine hydrolase [Dehalococcoidia bacterium]|nr:cysteine hydrolase [Dehalococcoidia bacterium]